MSDLSAFAKWKLIDGNEQSGHYLRYSPKGRDFEWHVVKYPKGWYWYTALRTFMNVHTSSEVGPFTSAAAAKADCETAHK